MSELDVLNKKLTSSLTQYEETYREKFMFRGKWYLDEMYNDSKRMPELSHAMGSVTSSEMNKIYNAVESGGSPGVGGTQSTAYR
jgi:hypothetical protein